jgi:hypothetical protein
LREQAAHSSHQKSDCRHQHHIQVSTKLTSWTTLTNFIGTNSTITFRDPAATNSNRRVYRATIP